MKIAKRSADSPRDATVSVGDIDAGGYGKAAASFIAASGKGFVIRALEGGKGSLATNEPATEAQWIAWMAYFAAKGIPHRFALSHGLMTVPCEWPVQFDCTAPVADKNAKLPRPAPPVSRARRSETAKRMTALAASLSFGDHRRKRTDVGAMSAVEAERHLGELTEKFRSTPVERLGVWRGSEPRDEGTAA